MAEEEEGVVITATKTEATANVYQFGRTRNVKTDGGGGGSTFIERAGKIFLGYNNFLSASLKGDRLAFRVKRSSRILRRGETTYCGPAFAT